MFVKANGIDIYYETVGKGKPLVMLHGNGEDNSRFAGLAANLMEKYSIYMPDTRLHGKSNKTETISYLEMMEDAAAFITTLGLEKPILLGFSDGGITGLLLAIHYPEILSGLIACGANTHPSQISKFFFLIVKISYFFKKDPKLLHLMLTEPDIRKDELASIKVPTLIVAGTRDIISVTDMKEIAAAIPESELIILKGETHDSYFKHHEKLHEAILPFLNSVPSGC